MVRYITTYHEERLQLIGPFDDAATASAWAEKLGASSWFLVPELLECEYGMLESSPVDETFVPVFVENPE